MIKVEDADSELRSIHAMLHPASIAILGASERSGYGGHFLRNLIDRGSKARLYPVNPNHRSIFGLPCYPTVRDIPEAVDVAGIIVSADQVIPAFRDCVAAGARSAIVVSAGFAELGTPHGTERQASLQSIARSSGVRVCGPNCLGVANVLEGSWCTSTGGIPPDLPVIESGIGLVSQSGATCYRMLVPIAQDRGIGFRYLVTTGNEADLESSDFIRYMLKDPNIKVVAAVVEGFKDAGNFIRAARLAMEVGKPIVILKIGRSEAGSRGASSHTAAMTGADAVHDALFKQRGVVRVDDYDELLETAAMFTKSQAPRGNRVTVVSESGGMASFLADKCGEAGLEVPPLSEATRDKLIAIMGGRGSAANPADLTLFGASPELRPVLEHLLAEDRTDMLIMSSMGGRVQAQAIVDAASTCTKPILFVWNGSTRLPGLDLLKSSTVPLFFLTGKAARAAKRLVDYHRTRESLIAEDFGERVPPAQDDRISTLREMLEAADGYGSTLTEHESKMVLSLFGVSVTAEEVCSDTRRAFEAAQRLGYPVALKVVSRDIGHKTESGGVRLGIPDTGSLAVAFDQIVSSVLANRSEARIDGVLVQQMVTGGVEVIVGISQDVQFGPVLMLGMGGLMAEAMSAASWRLCPVNRREAHVMIDEVKGLRKMLTGFRGMPPADIDALVDTLVNVSILGDLAKREIASLDINPLAVLPKGKGAVALDALIIPQVSGLHAM